MSELPVQLLKEKALQGLDAAAQGAVLLSLHLRYTSPLTAVATGVV